MGCGLQSAPGPVLLDVTSIKLDCILLLDSYFYVVVFHGSTVAAWRKAEFHKQDGHHDFAELLAVRSVCIVLGCVIKRRS